ncbi:SLBB domain-containing protein [Candidatus Sumerlaeota bacterium]|nr:SLBB domain-containing protein [Candidatus Sumerlaeota bacterium]
MQIEAQKALNRENWIRVGCSTCGLAAGAEGVYQTLKEELAERKLDIEVRRTGCNGMCHAEPLVEINVSGVPRTMYGNLKPEYVKDLLNTHLKKEKIAKQWKVDGVEALGQDDCGKPSASKQVRIVLCNCGIVDPTNIDDYIARCGYQGLKRALQEYGSEGVIEQLKLSGLRGRGGGGYPTHLKWEFVRREKSAEKYMICNGDEGDPGAYMDRSVLEGDPHAVVEGMIIAGYAIGATMGYFYIRAEYPLAVERIENAIRQARRLGLLGKNILGTDFSYDLEVRLGAGAFVCGEETALMSSVEGRRGYPWPRPPFPAQKGLWGNPSNINNVETLANVPAIMRNGGKWFAQFGTEESKGTKVFAVTGNVRKAGLIEIPMGTTLNTIVYDICGGPALGSNEVKAVQTGGPSGGVIPARFFETHVSYESLLRLGSIMGSGGLIVMDEQDSMVEIAKFYLGFCVEESCGKCAPCRIGGRQMLMLLNRISKGEGTTADIDALKRISHAMQKASLCGLGQTAPNPVLSTLRYFENEYTALLKDGAQAAGAR